MNKYRRCLKCGFVFIIPKVVRRTAEKYCSDIHCSRCDSVDTIQIDKNQYDKERCNR